jgi:hypothetical protein
MHAFPKSAIAAVKACLREGLDAALQLVCTAALKGWLRERSDADLQLAHIKGVRTVMFRFSLYPLTLRTCNSTEKRLSQEH